MMTWCRRLSHRRHNSYCQAFLVAFKAAKHLFGASDVRDKTGKEGNCKDRETKGQPFVAKTKQGSWDLMLIPFGRF